MTTQPHQSAHTDLDGLMAEEFRQPGARRRVPRMVVPLALALIVLVGIAVGLYPRRPVIERDDLSVTYAHIAPFEVLNPVEDGWVGEVGPGWAGEADPAAASAACHQLAAELRASAYQTISLLTHEGEPAADCTGTGGR